MRSQLTSLPFWITICSFASICQISWGMVERVQPAAGRRPEGAGFTPALANHRCSARTEGRTTGGVVPSRMARISPAPQVGWRRRSARAVWTPGGGSHGAFLGRRYEGFSPSSPEARKRARSRRTVEAGSCSVCAISRVCRPCCQSFQAARRIGTGMGRGMAMALGGSTMD
jgi:hypothetical protein